MSYLHHHEDLTPGAFDPAYRALGRGDILRPGDECYAFEGWMPVGENYHGVPVSKCSNKKLRRPIPKEGTL